MARIASLSEVEVELPEDDLRFRLLPPPPPALPVSSTVEEEEQQRTMKKEGEGRNLREVKEAKWISCFNGCKASIVPNPLFSFFLQNTIYNFLPKHTTREFYYFTSNKITYFVSI